MPTRKKFISVSNASVRAIAEELGVTCATVYNALSFNTDSELAKSIREKAVNKYGGIETKKIVW